MPKPKKHVPEFTSYSHGGGKNAVEIPESNNGGDFKINWNI